MLARSDQGTAAGPPITDDRLLDGRLQLYQPSDGYRIAIDPVLLAAAVPVRAGDHVFDLGTVLATGTVLRLIEAVIDLDLPQGTENALTAKLDAILLALDGNNVAAAINLLLAFINTAEAQSNHHIPEADAVILIAAALEIIALLSS